jgi:hypothetical protein
MKINPRSILIPFFIVAMLMLANNAAYYWFTKKSLTDALIHRMESTAVQIRISIEQSEEGSFYVEDLIGETLRSSAQYVQTQLSPNIDQITNEQLVSISKEAGIDGISLMKRVGDDIIVLKSSEPKELGLSTKTFGYWFTAFNQLLDKQAVAIPEGQKLLHFWSGIYEVPSSDSSTIRKFGYYNDGTTDYIICTFVNAEKILTYKQITGAVKVTEKTKAENSDILEISGFNALTFGKEPKVYLDKSGNPFISVYDQPVIFGSYEIINSEDASFVQQAISASKPISRIIAFNSKSLMKTYVPVPIKALKPGMQREIPYVIGIVSDYDTIKQTLNRQLVQLGVLVLLFSIISIVVLILAFRYVRKTKDTAVRTTQETYIDHVDRMFATIRSQRHDFLNHVQTVYGLITHGQKEDQIRYMKELLEEIYEVNDMIRIGHPAIAALIQSKVALSIHRKIQFHHEFTGLERFTLGVKSVDIVKIIGNLIDNAFDEASKLPVEERLVSVKGWSENGRLCISVTNGLASPLTQEEELHMFEFGYSTKLDGVHQGIGLSVVKERIEHYKGTIEIEATSEQIRFLLSIPIN